MTVPEFYSPRHLTHAQLDTFLARGWYRMHQTIFTTNHIIDDDKSYRVFWLRYNLQHYTHHKLSRQILHKNRFFTTLIKPFTLTTELENLYTLYRQTITFDGAPSVKHWLFHNEDALNIYDSHLVEIRDNDHLIAAGVFDKGKQSIAGIMNFYHPGYKKYSLGKHLILTKLDFATREGYTHYYPGYLVHGYPKFDYKLFIGKDRTEVYIPELKRWFPYSDQLMDIVVNER
ncbi:MAG: hypothetical protein KIT80_13995 [Chitinophagaceae bacterium]|nr:hypothetical protein [Chitinophagaceae bacterium]MCW5928023.1 hypothetical protein [Chitinophagaceae bacterium]